MKKGNSAQESGKCNNQLMNLISMLKVFFLLEKRRRIILLSRRVNAYDFLLLVIDCPYNMCLSSFCFMDARKKCVHMYPLLLYGCEKKKCVLQVEILLSDGHLDEKSVSPWCYQCSILLSMFNMCCLERWCVLEV